MSLSGTVLGPKPSGSAGGTGSGLPAAGSDGQYLKSSGGVWVPASIAESEVTGLVSDLALKAPIASPTFTGTVTLPEGNDAAAGTASRRTLGLTGTKAMPGTTTLDAVTAPAADVSLNSHKITNQADPTAAQDSATKAYVDKPLLPNVMTANDGIVRQTDTASALTGLLLPYLYPIEPKGRRSFPVSSLAIRVGTFVAASHVGAAIYSWSLSGSTFTLTLVAVMSAETDSGSAAGTKIQAVTGAPITLDFTTTRYFAAGMVSTLTTLTVVCLGATPGIGCVRYTGAARSTTVDFPATIDNNGAGANNGAALAVGGAKMPWVGLVDATGVNWP